MTALTQIPNSNNKIDSKVLTALNDMFNPEKKQLVEKEKQLQEQRMIINREQERMDEHTRRIQDQMHEQKIKIQDEIDEKKQLSIELERERQEKELQSQLNNELLVEKQEVVKEIEEIQTKKNNFCSDLGNIKFIFIFVIAITVTMNSYYDNILPVFLQDNYAILLMSKVLLCLLVFFILSKF
jgi:hypothetical protein